MYGNRNFCCTPRQTESKLYFGINPLLPSWVTTAKRKYISEAVSGSHGQTDALCAQMVVTFRSYQHKGKEWTQVFAWPYGANSASKLGENQITRVNIQHGQ